MGMTTSFVRRAGTLTAVSGLLVFGSATAALADTSKDEAGTIVTDKYGGEVISVESDSENGEATWEVEVKNSDKGRIEVDVSQSSGEIVAIETEDDSDEDHSDGTDADDKSDPGDESQGSKDSTSGDSSSDDGAAADGNGDSASGDDAEGQVSPQPEGGVETGDGSTDGVENVGLLAAGGALIAGAGIGTVALRRRASK